MNSPTWTGSGWVVNINGVDVPLLQAQVVFNPGMEDVLKTQNTVLQGMATAITNLVTQVTALVAEVNDLKDNVAAQTAIIDEQKEHIGALRARGSDLATGIVTTGRKDYIDQRIRAEAIMSSYPEIFADVYDGLSNPSELPRD